MDSNKQDDDLGVDGQIDFVEETLQITDVHVNLESSATFQELPSTLETTLDSPFSISKFLKQSPEDAEAQTSSSETPNLQSELASLGFTPFGNATDHDISQRCDDVGQPCNDISQPCDDITEHSSVSSSECSDDEFVEAVEIPDNHETNCQNLSLNKNTSIQNWSDNINVTRLDHTNGDESVTDSKANSSTEDRKPTCGEIINKIGVCEDDEFKDADDTGDFLPVIDNNDRNQMSTLVDGGELGAANIEETESGNISKDASMEKYPLTDFSINMEPFSNIEIANGSVSSNERSAFFALQEVQFLQNSSHDLTTEMSELSAVLKLEDDLHCNDALQNQSLNNILEPSPDVPIVQLENFSSDETCTSKENLSGVALTLENERESENVSDKSIKEIDESFALQDIHFLQDAHFDNDQNKVTDSFNHKESLGINQRIITQSSFHNDNEVTCPSIDTSITNHTPETNSPTETNTCDNSFPLICIKPTCDIYLNESKDPETTTKNISYRENNDDISADQASYVVVSSVENDDNSANKSYDVAVSSVEKDDISADKASAVAVSSVEKDDFFADKASDVVVSSFEKDEISADKASDVVVSSVEKDDISADEASDVAVSTVEKDDISVDEASDVVVSSVEEDDISADKASDVVVSSIERDDISADKASDVAVSSVEKDDISADEASDVAVSSVEKDDISVNKASDVAVSSVEKDDISANKSSDVAVSSVEKDDISADEASDVVVSSVEKDDISENKASDVAVSSVEKGDISADHAPDVLVSSVEKDDISADKASTVAVTSVEKDDISADEASDVVVSSVEKDDISENKASDVAVSSLEKDDISANKSSDVAVSSVAKDDISADEASDVVVSSVEKDDISENKASDVAVSSLEKDGISADHAPDVLVSSVEKDDISADKASAVAVSLVEKDDFFADKASDLVVSSFEKDEITADKASDVVVSSVEKDDIFADEASDVAVSSVEKDDISLNKASDVVVSSVEEDDISADKDSDVAVSSVEKDDISTDEASDVAVSSVEKDDISANKASDVAVSSVEKDDISANKASDVAVSSVEKDDVSADEASDVVVSSVEKDDISADKASAVAVTSVEKDDISADEASDVVVSSVEKDDISANKSSDVAVSSVEKDDISADEVSDVVVSSVEKDDISENKTSDVAVSSLEKDDISANKASDVAVSSVEKDDVSADQASDVAVSSVEKDDVSANKSSDVAVSSVEKDDISADEASVVAVSSVEKDDIYADQAPDVVVSSVEKDDNSADEASDVMVSSVEKDDISANKSSDVAVSSVEKDDISADEASDVVVSSVEKDDISENKASDVAVSSLEKDDISADKASDVAVSSVEKNVSLLENTISPSTVENKLSSPENLYTYSSVKQLSQNSPLQEEITAGFTKDLICSPNEVIERQNGLSEKNVQCEKEDVSCRFNLSLHQEQIPPETEAVENLLSDKSCLDIDPVILESKENGDEGLILPQRDISKVDEAFTAEHEDKEGIYLSNDAVKVCSNSVQGFVDHSLMEVVHKNGDLMPSVDEENDISLETSGLITIPAKDISSGEASFNRRSLHFRENDISPENECNYGEICEYEEGNKRELTFPDMSMTLASNVCNISSMDDDFHKNGVDTSLVKTSEAFDVIEEVGSCDTIDFVQNMTLNEVNSFSENENQKKFDAVYLFTNGSKENSCDQTVTDHGIQCMEITMANINPLCEHSLLQNSTVPPNHFLPSFEEESDSEQSKQMCFTPTRFDQVETTYLGIGSIQEESHELMQQSMSQYVINGSLHLTIPDSSEPTEVQDADDEVRRRQCELQTEHVLLMKWPAEYHKKLKAISEENQKLSAQLESGKKKDIELQNLHEENLNLVKTMKDINQEYEILKESNKSLVETLTKQNTENNNTIKDLQQENYKLYSDLNQLKNLELQLRDLQHGNAELQKSIESLNKSKDGEIQVLTDKIKFLEQDLIVYNDTINKLQKENDELSNLAIENDTKTKEVTLERDSLREMVDSLNPQAEELQHLQHINEELKQSLEQMRDTTELDNLKVTMQDLKVQNDLLWHQLSSCSCLETERNKDQLIQEKMAQLQAEVSKLKAENQQLLETIESKNETLTNLTAVKKKLKSSLFKVNSKLNGYERDNAELKEKNKELNLKLNDRNSKFSLLHETVAQFEKENSVLQIEILNIQEHLNPLSENLSSMLIERDLLIEQMKSGETENDELTQNLSSLQNKNHNLEQSLLSLQDQVKVFESERSELLNDFSSLSETLQSLLEENRVLNQQNTKIGENNKIMNQLVCERDQLSEEIAVMNQQIEKLEGINNGLILQLESLQRQTQAFEKERNELMNDLSSLSESIQSLLEDNAILKEQKCNAEINNKQIEKLVCQNNELSQATTDMKQHIQELQDIHSAFVEEKSLETECLQDIVREMEKQVSSLSEELMSEMFKYDSIVLSSEDIVEVITKEKSELQIELLNVLQRLSDVKAHNEMCKKEIQLYEAAKVQYEDTVRDLSSQLEVAKLKTEDFEKDNYKIREAANNLENTNITLNNLIESNGLEIKLLSKQLKDLKSQNSELLFDNTSLTTNLSSKAQIESELQDLNRELENHISSLNEELLSEITKTDILERNQRTYEQQISEITQEKMTLQNSLSNVERENAGTLEKLEKLEHMCQALEEGKQELDSTISKLREDKFEIEKQLQLETSKVQIAETLTQEISSKSQTLIDVDNLRTTLTKEINSLTGGVNSENFESYSIIDIYQKFMTEFLTKEREVITALESDFEVKFRLKLEEAASLQKSLYEKEEEISNMEKACDEITKELGYQKQTYSNMESECQSVKQELSSKEEEVSRLKEALTSIEVEKKECLENLRSDHADLVLELEEKIKFMSDEIMCKDDEISKLGNEIEMFKFKESDLSEVEKQTTTKIEELNAQILQEKENAANLNCELENKHSEIEQLMTFVEAKNKKLTEYEKSVDEMSKKLCCFEKEISLVSQTLTSADKVDCQVLQKSVENCHFLGNILQKIAHEWEMHNGTLESKLVSLNSELKNRLEIQRNLETQINCLNEELKAQKLLYDEDILQLREEVTLKSEIVEGLKSENSALKLEKAHVVEQPDSEEINQIKEALEHLKDENLRLREGVTQFNIFKEVNRKLSLEMEDLTRSIKLEKENNYALKAKNDSAANQILDLEKVNYQLEDKIDTLESQLRNQNVLSSIKIKFPCDIDTVDKQVVFINERITEFEKIKRDFDDLLDDHKSLKSDSEKAKEFMKRQEEKISKVLKRELDLKKQIASSSMASSNESKLLQTIKSELFSFYPGLSLQESIANIRKVLEADKHAGNSPTYEDIRKQLEEALQENKDLDNECDMMNKHIKQQESDLILAYQREEELTKENKELKNNVGRQGSGSSESVEKLFRVFPTRPTSLDQALDMVKHAMSENKILKDKAAEAQEEYSSLNKECDDMLAQYQAKEEELVEVLEREAALFAEMTSTKLELETKIKSLNEDLRQMAGKERTPSTGSCECNELKSRVSELRIELSNRSAKITSLELQLEADNFPIKKKNADLEKSLEQAKQKMNELKAEVRRYQMQAHEVTVGMRLECENCRRNSTQQNSELSESMTSDLKEQLAKKDKDIAILKALCKSRNQRITELEQATDLKTPRVLRSALKEGKENLKTPLSPTKKPKNVL